MTLPTCCDAECFIHCDKCEEANHDTEAQQEVPVWFHHDEADVVWGVFSEEDFWEKME